MPFLNPSELNVPGNTFLLHLFRLKAVSTQYFLSLLILLLMREIQRAQQNSVRNRDSGSIAFSGAKISRKTLSKRKLRKFLAYSVTLEATIYVYLFTQIIENIQGSSSYHSSKQIFYLIKYPSFSSQNIKVLFWIHIDKYKYSLSTAVKLLCSECIREGGHNTFPG